MVHRLVQRRKNLDPKWYVTITEDDAPGDSGAPVPLPDAQQVALESIIAAGGLEDRNYTAVKSNEGDEGTAAYFFGGGSNDELNDMTKQILDS